MNTLSHYTHTFPTDSTVKSLLPLLQRGDHLCILDNMHIETGYDKNSITNQIDTWSLYPITDKTRCSLITNNLRWNNFYQNNLQTSDGKHVVCCWITDEDLHRFLAQPSINTNIQTLRNKIILTHTQIATVQEDDHGVKVVFNIETGGWEAVEDHCVECGYPECECVDDSSEGSGKTYPEH